MKTARLNIVIEPEEKEMAERLAAEYSRRSGVETTLSSFVRHLIRQAALETVTGGGSKKERVLPLPQGPSVPPAPGRANNWP